MSRFNHTHSFSVRGVTYRPRTLEAWNEYRREYWEAVKDRIAHPEKYPCGLDCPNCGGYLYDTGKVIDTAPVKLQVKCQRCNFKGNRYE